MKKKRIYKKENCRSLIRTVIKDRYGRTITVAGTHAFDYDIIIEGITGNIFIEHFASRKDASTRFKELTKR